MGLSSLSFNSLFEMRSRTPPTKSPLLSEHPVSILYLRCPILGPAAKNTPSTVSVSILYLRCRQPRLVPTDVLGVCFNSLFEMPGRLCSSPSTSRMRWRVSILYLRCRLRRRRHCRRLYGVSILYLRCNDLAPTPSPALSWP